MKISKIIGIVCWSLVAVLLTGVMVTAMTGGVSVFNPLNFVNFSGNLNISYESAVPSDEITDIDIDWTSGYVNLTAYDDEGILLTEFSSKELNNDEKMSYSVITIRLP